MALIKFLSGIFGSKEKKPDQPPPVLSYEGNTLSPKPGDTVLDTLLEAGFPIPNSCRSGACQSCMMMADPSTRDNLPSASQEPLTQAERDQGLFLPCCTLMTGSLNVSMPGDLLHPSHEATISSVTPLNNQVMGLRLSLKSGLNYHPGQFVNLRFTDANQQQVQRSYSLASVPGLDQELEFHIKLIENGVASQWLSQDAQAGQTVTLEGPHGHCYFNDDQADLPTLLLAGLGTGLAPLWGIARDALQRGYKGDIHFLVGAKSPQGLYLIDQLQALANQHSQIKLAFLVQESSNSEGPWQAADIYDYCQQLDIDYSRTGVFLCGAESFVQKMKKACFMKGTSMRNIYADVFVSTS